jgi:hypothetical protein
MAENLENPSMGNFSIQDTMEMGMGNQELLSDLFAPETSTTNPDDIQDIKDEPAPVAKPSKKTTAPAAVTEDGDEEKKEDNTKSLQDFLLGGDDEEDEDDSPAPAPKAKAPVDTEDEEETEGDEPASAFTSENQ